MQGCIHEKSYKKTILKKIDVYKIKKKPQMNYTYQNINQKFI